MLSNSTIVIIVIYHIIAFLLTILDFLILRNEHRNSFPNEVELLKWNMVSLFPRWQTFLGPTLLPLVLISFVVTEQPGSSNLDLMRAQMPVWGLALLPAILLYAFIGKWILTWHSSYADVSVSRHGLHYRPHRKWYTFAWSAVGKTVPAKFPLNPIKYGYYITIDDISPLPRWQRWYLSKGLFKRHQSQYALLVNLSPQSVDILRDEKAKWIDSK